MQIGNFRWPSPVSAVLGWVFLSTLFAFAAGGAELRGTVSDPLGAIVPHAEVTLLRNNPAISQTTTDALGEFVFSSLNAGRYRVRATAPGFTEQESPEVYVGGEKVPHIVLPLKIGTVTQQVVVSATGTPAPDSQVGASVAVIRDVNLTEKLDVLDPLRLVPGVQILQTGPRGGTTDLFVRGGNAGFEPQEPDEADRVRPVFPS